VAPLVFSQECLCASIEILNWWFFFKKRKKNFANDDEEKEVVELKEQQITLLRALEKNSVYTEENEF